jgi:L-rhamnono-1,4-lactonase
MEQLPTTEKQKLDFAQWKSFMKRFASFPNVYVKLSGFFSEISDQSPSNPMHVSNILDRVMPWVEHVLDCFKARRVMFGSDWPVCNIRGPGDELSWQHWHKVVDNILERTELNQTDKDRIWFGTAAEAYKIDISKLNLESTVN